MSATSSGTPDKSTPAKKAAPSKSLSDLLGKEDSNVEHEEKTTGFKNRKDHTSDSEKNDNKSADEQNKDDNEDKTDSKRRAEANLPENTPDTPSSEEVNKEQEKNTVIGLTDKDSIKKDDSDTHPTSGLSKSVVHATSTSTSKTPAELAAESPEETAKRYDIDNKVSQEDIDNPRVQIYSDTVVKQVPSGTHLHPDIAKDLHNYGIASTTTDSAQVRRQITDTHDFADDAKHNDKF